MRKRKPKASKRLLFVFFVAIIILAVVGFWWINRPPVYKDFITAKNSSDKFQIDVAKQMKLAQSGINILDYQDVKNDPAKDLVSHVRVESQFVGGRYIDKTKDAISTQLKDKKGSFYDSFRQKASNSPSASDLSFGDFRGYGDNPDKLVADFSYSYPSVEVSGKMMIAFSKDSLYIVTIEATKNVWNKNSDAWNRILSSFKED